MGRGPISNLTNLFIWLTGVLVSLAVGFGMIGNNGVPILPIPYVPDLITVIAGWIVVVLTLISVILAIINRAK